MKRTFHPVGQGAFYTEKFGTGHDTFTVVYDCGTSSDLKILIQEINAVFISHLHADHVNGLKFLSEYCKITKIFMPLVTEKDKVLLLVHNAIQGGGEFAAKLITSPEKIFKEDQLVLVPAATNNEETPESNNRDSDQQKEAQLNEDVNSSNIVKNANLTSAKMDDYSYKWYFVPFNFQQTEMSKAFFAELEKSNIFIDDVQQYHNQIKFPGVEKTIKETYKTVVKKDLNTYSMTLFSGPGLDSNNSFTAEWFTCQKHCTYNLNYECECSNHYETRCRASLFRNWYFTERPGCLYFGDYNAKGKEKWQQISSRYEDYWKNIGVVQIPHHGSNYNYNSKINQGNTRLSIISASAGNKHHPHMSTIQQIIQNDGKPVVVTEDDNSRVVMEIRIKQIYNMLNDI